MDVYSLLLTVSKYELFRNKRAGKRPAVEDGGQSQEATVSNIPRSCIAAVNDPVQQSLSILVEY